MFNLLSAIHLKPEYIAIMAASLIIIISFMFNFVAKKTNIPSVLLLLILGVGIQFIAPELKDDPLVSQLLIVVGKVGLILIVLEAALDLKLEKEKLGLIGRSLLMALFGLVGSALLIALAVQYFLDAPFVKALSYAVPLSIMSSAIIIPSVGSLAKEKKEFMIYESTFSDIFGIIFFQFLTASSSYQGAGDVALNVVVDLLITITIAIVLSYLLVWMFNNITSNVKLFLIISVLMLVYAVGSVFGISSLIIILFFGLILNNIKLFFRGPLEGLVKEEEIKPVFHEFHVITLESAFVLRTFFFVMFGLSITLANLVSLNVALTSIAIVAILYIVRYLFLKLLLWGKSIMPELYLAPRGLITVLLFYTIPNGEHHATQADLEIYQKENKEYVFLSLEDDKHNKIVADSTLAYNAEDRTYLIQIPEENMQLSNFDEGILLYTILITSIIMTIALISSRGQNVREVLIDNLNLNYIEDQLERKEEEEYFEQISDDVNQDEDLSEFNDKNRKQSDDSIVKENEPEDE